MNPSKTHQLTRQTINQVCQEGLANESLRKYYRFRYSSQFYGGIVTADVVGCNLRCGYCWSQKTAWFPRKGSWYSADQVVRALMALSEKHNCHRMRLSGGEPTLCKEHLLSVLEQIPDDILFVLETNGILLSESTYIQALKNAQHRPYIRISLKAGQTLFSKVTGAPIDIYKAQLHAIELLQKSSLRFNVAIMAEFFTSKEISDLEAVVRPKQLEIEQLLLYPFVREKLRRRGLSLEK
ncbi:MAG: radical SAM protein [Candidatus Hermodarchaeota archaeon]